MVSSRFVALSNKMRRSRRGGNRAANRLTGRSNPYARGTWIRKVRSRLRLLFETGPRIFAERQKKNFRAGPIGQSGLDGRAARLATSTSSRALGWWVGPNPLEWHDSAEWNKPLAKVRCRECRRPRRFRVR